ncbi:MAG: lactate racemase domain-containing protein [Dehalococcoidia bacterium]
MQVTLPHGDATVSADLPERTRVVRRGGGGQARERQEVDQEGIVRAAITSPLGIDRIRGQVKPGDQIVIAFDDGTITSYGPIRRLAIEAVLAELAAAGVEEANVQLVCANALHRKWTREELASMIGDELVRRFGDRLYCHDAEDRDNIVDLGTTPSGYAVDLSRAAVEADLLVYINAACFLGFSGGWKSIAVGLSTWRSISHTHTPDGMSMSVKNNRFHAVLNEMGELIEQRLPRRPFKVETILRDPMTVSQVFAGGVRETRDAAIEVLSASVPQRRSQAEPADVVVYGVPDWSPYAAFGHTNPILNLLSSGLGYLGGYIEALGKPGCTVILASPCPERWDMEHHPSYKEVWDRVLPETKDPYEITERFGEDFATNPSYIDSYRNGVAFHGVHGILATHPLKRLRHAGRVIVAGAQDPAVPRHVGFTAAATVEDAVSEAVSIHGADCSIVCVN